MILELVVEMRKMTLPQSPENEILYPREEVNWWDKENFVRGEKYHLRKVEQGEVVLRKKKRKKIKRRKIFFDFMKIV